MKRFLLPVLFSTLGLAGCVAVPAAPYGYGYYGVEGYAPAPAVVVQPAFVYRSDRYYGGHYRHRHYR